MCKFNHYGVINKIFIRGFKGKVKIETMKIMLKRIAGQK